ncbi:YSIRK-type signal peptide-containing protein [Dolosigranulum savutiense]|uniref:YSIRK-type signal peptide-containing protein n=1 Tax=Dolosigranulum savutiense TaxID=3110288 RepID=A0AB74U0Q6_9LACT
MVGKNNTQERFRRNATKDKRYTLKKLSVGLASVALGTVLFLNGAETVSAETEVSEPNETTDALSEVEQVTQPVQSTFQFSYVRNGGQIDGFTGDYANAHEAEKAFRHHANQHGYTLLNIRLEGNTFIADVQADNSTFQFNYLNEATGEKLDSFFGDYLNASEAEKDFRNYANEHGYTLSNVRLEGNTFTADVAVAEESQPAEATFQFIYRNKETGKKLDGFFSDYSNASEAEKDFRNYANQHGYTLSNIRKNGQTFTADVVRQEQSGTTDSDRYVEAAKQRARQLINALDNLTAEQKADYLAQVEAAESVAQVEAVYDEAKNVVNEVEKDYSYTLNFGDRTESANLGEFDSEEQAELALRILTNEKGYKLSNLRLEGRTFIADAKVETEQDQSSEQTNRYLQEAKKRALEIINGLENLFDTQKPSYLERIENADSVAAVEAIVEEAQNYVNESKGGENGQAAEEPERPEYNPEQNLVTYDIQITDHNGKTQTQRVTFPSRELALNYISQLVRSYEKAGVVLNEERSDVEGRDNTFILVFEKKQAEQKPELDVPTPNENAPAPEKLDTAKAEALDAIAGLKYLSAKEKEELVELINEADNLTEVNYLVGAAYKLNINKFPGKVPAPEELDVAKAEALDAIAGLEYLSEEEKAGFVERINETVELGEVNRLVGLAFKRNIENFPEKTPEQDPEEEAGRELDVAKAEALDAIAGLEYLSEEEKAGFVERINETVELGEVNRLVGLAFKRNIENFPEKTPEQDPEEEAGRELDAAKAEALDAIAGLEYLSEEEKAGFVERINETVELGEVNRLVGLAFKRNIEKLPEKEGQLQESKATLSDKINTLVKNATRKAEFLAEVAGAETLEALETIDDNVDSYVSIQDHEELEATKEALTAKVGAVVERDEDKVNFLQAIDKAETLEELLSIEERVDALADTADKAELQEAKATLSDKINTLVKNATRKAEFLAEVADAETLEALETIDDNVDSYVSIQDHEELEVYKKAAKEIIDGLDSLSGEGKTVIKDEINQATTTEEINKLVDEARGISSENNRFDMERLKEKKEDATNVVDQFSAEQLLSEKQVEKFKKAIENAENLDAVDSIVVGVQRQVFENQKAAAVQSVEDDINLSETLKGKYVSKLEAAETAEQLDELLLELDKDEVRELIDQFVADNYLAKEDADIHKENLVLSTDEATVEQVKENVLASVFVNQKEAVVQNVKDDKSISEDLKKEFIPKLEKATTGEELNAILLDLDKAEVQELIDQFVADNYLAKEDADIHKENLALSTDEATVEQVKENVLASVFVNQKEAVVQNVKDDKSISEDLKKEFIPKLEKATTGEELNAILLDLDKAEVQELIDQFVADNYLAKEDADIHKENLALSTDEATVEQVKENVLASVFVNQKEAVVQNVKDDKSISEDLKKEFIPKLEKATTGEELNAILLDLDKAEVQELIDQFVADNYLAKEDADIHKENLALSTDEATVEQVKENVLASVFVNQKEAVVQNVKDDKSISEDLKKEFIPKLEKATTGEELNAILLDLDKAEVQELIDQFVADNYLAKEDADIHKENLALSTDEATVEQVKENVLASVFVNQKEAVVQNVKDDKSISEDLKKEFIPKLEKATTGYELDKVLNTLSVEEAVEKAVHSTAEAQKALDKTQENNEVSATDQGLIRAANTTVREDLLEANKLVDEFSSQYVEELKTDEELEQRLNGWQERLKDVKEVKVPSISEETLEEFKAAAIKNLKNIVPNLSDTERKVYEDIIKRMKSRDDSENNVNEIVQVGVAEGQLKRSKNEQDQVKKDKFKKRAQIALDFVKGTFDDEENYPEYKKELLKQKQHIQNLLNDEATQSNGDLTPKESYKNKLEETRKVAQELITISGELKNGNTLIVKEAYQKALDKYEKNVLKLKELAETEEDRKQAEGLENLLNNLKTNLKSA